jgi:hypothetical protein
VYLFIPVKGVYVCMYCDTLRSYCYSVDSVSTVTHNKLPSEYLSIGYIISGQVVYVSNYEVFSEPEQWVPGISWGKVAGGAWN